MAFVRISQHFMADNRDDRHDLISFLITGRIRWALSIGFVELFTKMTLYYLHERLWNKVSFGRTRLAEDYEI